MKYLLTIAENPKKRYMVITPENKAIQFGSSEHENYTIHKDDDRKSAYLKRHKTREDWSDLNRAGTWSRWLLWNQKTLMGSIRDMEDRFGINIIAKVKK